MDITVRIVHNKKIHTLSTKFTRIKIYPPNIITELTSSSSDFSIDRGYVTLYTKDDKPIDPCDEEFIKGIGMKEEIFDVQIIMNSDGKAYIYKNATMTYTQATSLKWMFQFDIYNNFTIDYIDDFINYKGDEL